MKAAQLTKWKPRWSKLMGSTSAMLTSVLLSSMQSAVAQDGATAGGDQALGGERVLRAPAAASSNAVSRKRYAGGADEDDLQMQATLPIPSRTLDGSPVTMASGESDEGQAPPPAND